MSDESDMIPDSEIRTEVVGNAPQSREGGNGSMSNALLAVNTIALLLSMFLTSLDLAIISTAVPRISHDFHALNDVGWYGSAFFLTMAVFQSIWGKVYKYVSLKYGYMAAIFVFEMGTLGCAVSQSSAGFIASRAIAGLGAAGVTGGTYTILAHIVPSAKLPMFYGLTGIIFTLASVAGPLIGGAFTSDVTWRWCFYINLPFGGLSIAALSFFLHLPSSANAIKVSGKELLLRLDIPGCVCIIGSFICYLLALEWAGIQYPWSSSRVVGLLVGWIVLTVLFISVEYYQGDRSLIGPCFLRNRGILVCCIFIFLLNLGNYVRLYYVPIYFQAIHNSSPEGSGVLLLAFIVTNSALTLVSGGLLSKFGYYQLFLITGAMFASIGSGLMYTWSTQFSIGKSIGYQVLAGLGDGISVQVPMTAVQAFTDPSEIPTVTATALFFLLSGGVLGVAAGESIFTNRLLQLLPRYAPGVSHPSILNLGAFELEQAFQGTQLVGVRQAYMVGIKDAFLLMIVSCMLACIVALLAPPISITGKIGTTRETEAVGMTGGEEEKTDSQENASK